MSFVRFLFRNLVGYRFLVVIAIIMTIGQVGADILSAYPLKFITDKLTVGHKDPTTLPDANALIAFFEHFGDRTTAVIMLSITIMLVLGAISGIMSFVEIFLATSIAKKLTARLSKRLFDHLQRLPVEWHNQNEQGDLVQRITGNMADIDKFITDGMVDAFGGILTFFGVIVFMLYTTNLSFTLLSVAIIPLLIAIGLKYTGRIKAATKKEKKAEGKVASVASETMAKIMEIKAFTLENFISGQFTGRADEKLQEGQRAGGLQAQFTPLVNVMLVLGTAMIVGIGAFVINSPKGIELGPIDIPQSVISVGTLVALIPLLAKLYQPIKDFSKLPILATNAASGAERIQEVLDGKIEALEIPEDYQGPRRLTGNITYEDTFFCYSFPGPPILKGINLNIKAGEKVALVGLSGSGKTTLTNLLPRFYEVPPGWGKVQIDGTDISKYPLTVVRQNISVVLQDSILFDGTIRENIKIGRPQASDAEMYRAAEQACIHDTIMKKPNGYDERTINQGKNLSGGQRQRIAIARAILRDAPIIIMDEPTASLDVEAEAEVMRALDGLAEGRTVLMITHRLSTVGKVDKIVVLKDGRVVEEGTYSALKKKEGTFANLLKVQNVLEMDENTQSLIQTATPLPDQLHSKGEILIEADGQIIGKHPLNKIVMTIGRAPQNDMAISFDQNACRAISRLHAKLLRKNNTWVIEDAESKHGIYYNGTRIEHKDLVDGDRIFLTPTIALIYKQQNQVSQVPHIPPTLQVPPIPPVQHKAQVLIEIDGQIIGQRLLDKTVLNIGRKWGESDHEIQIASQFIARQQHAQITWENGVWSIKSMNNKSGGMLYNCQIVTQHAFANGDRIYLAPRIALIYQILP